MIIDPNPTMDELDHLFNTCGMQDRITCDRTNPTDLWWYTPLAMYFVGRQEFKEKGFTTQGAVCGIIQLDHLNDACVRVHIVMMPGFVDGQNSRELCDGVYEILRDKTDVRTIIAEIPDECKYLHRFLKRHGFTKGGYIPKAVSRKGKIMGVTIFYRHVE